MSLGVSAVPASVQNATSENMSRKSANFHPTIWGDYFLQRTSPSTENSASSDQIQVLKQEVREMLTAATDKPSQKLNLIDAIQRLGIAYHFEREIEEALEEIHNYPQDYENSGELYIIALQFRLLRQQGFNVSSDIFKKFMDEEGRFKESLVKDAQGMLSLYEAAYLSVHGEDILDEALLFTTTHLKSIATKLLPPLSDRVSHALHRPIRKGVTRHEAWHYISIYQQQESHVEAVLKLAKLDFNFVQNLHREELSAITTWWKTLDFAKKLPFARDRVVECYYWPLGVFFEPQFAFGRKILTKLIAIFSVIDDIYDVYGTIEELELFTKVLERCDTTINDCLPDYMKVCYQELLNFFSEVEEEMIKEGRSYCMFYAKEAVKNLSRAYLTEAKWLNEGYIPTMEEYTDNALTTSVYPLITTVTFFGMGETSSKDVFDWLLTGPKIVKGASAICRFMDDIVSHKFEQSRGHVASAVECYMKQHSVSEQEAYEELNKRVAKAWKDINEELLKPTPAPMPLLTCVLNLARVIDVVYKEEDGYTHSKFSLKQIITTLIVNPVAI